MSVDLELPPPAPDPESGPESGPQSGPVPEPAPAFEPAPATVRVEWAMVPQVNLLPPEILEARAFRRLKIQLGLMVLAVLVLAALISAWSYSRVASAEDAYDAAQGELTQLQRQQTRYAEVPRIRAELDAARSAREGAMATHVAWYGFLGDLALSMPQDTRLTSVSITMDGTVRPAGSAVPLQPAGIGLVSVIGKAGKFVDVASWLESVTEVHGMGGPTLQTAATSPDGSGGGSTLITFNGSAVVTPAALSHLYDRKAG